MLTLTSALAAGAAQVLGAGEVVPLHVERWRHFTEGADVLAAAFRGAGISERGHILEPGEAYTL